MDTPLIVGAKLARPRLPQVLDRGRLLDVLVAGVPGHPLTLVCAGAGYGKTTLLASFADRYPAGVLWYSLGPEDADFAVFLWHLVTGLSAHHRRFGRSLRGFLEEGAVSPRAAATAAGAFLNDLARIREPMAVVLDDLHLVSENPALVRFLSTVLENLKSPVRFVVASRTEPPLPLGRLRARRQVLELGPPDLAFTRDELRDLLREIYERNPSAEALDLVARSTEGWVAAVQLVLAADAGRTGLTVPAALRRATRPGSALHDYLAQEVLDRQPAELRDWMLRTAVFDEIDPEVTATVLEDEAVEERLAGLAGRRLLLAFDGPRGPVYRYHALLRDFLRRRYRTAVPAGERKRIHERAAAEFTRRGDLTAAARQWELGGDPALLADFLRDHGLTLVDQGHYQALLAWFEGLPPELLDGEPRLRLRLGDVRHYLGDLPGAELEYERAQAAFREAEDVEGEAWATVGLARIWNLRGQAERAAREGEEALARLERSRPPARGAAGRGGKAGAKRRRAGSARTGAGSRAGRELRTRLLQVVSGSHFYLGRYAEALELLDRLEALARGNAERQAAVWNNRAVVFASQGNYQEAARAFQRGLERPGARRSPRASLHLSNLALLLLEMGDTERAQALFAEALELARTFRNRSQELSGLMGTARLHHRLGDTEGALERLREAETLNAELKVPLIESDALALRAQILSEAGQTAGARAALSQALAAYGASSRDANWLTYRIEAAVVELRAGRVAEARQALAELHPLALELEARFPRMLLLFHLGEAERRLDGGDAEAHLAEALRLGREMGYDSALRAEMRVRFDPFAFLLVHGRESEYVGRLAAGLGPGVEPALLDLAGGAVLPEASARAITAALAEAGGPRAHAVLRESPWKEDPKLAPGVAAALLALERRHPELSPARPAAGGGLSLTTLGGLVLSGPRGEIPRGRWKSQRALSIFVYLAVQGGRGVAKDRLIELFWPGRQTRSAEKNFHPTLSYVRAALKDAVAGPVVTVADGLYGIDPGLAVTVDVRRFEARLAEAASAKGKTEALRLLEEALNLYRGDFLGDRYENWAEDLRTRLALRYETALADTADLQFDARDYHRALNLYRQLLERNPYREEIHAKAMMCYHHVGDRRAVRDQFQRLEALLRRELDVDPLPETRSLYETLMVSP